jgi:hypothetical protein
VVAKPDELPHRSFTHGRVRFRARPFLFVLLQAPSFFETFVNSTWALAAQGALMRPGFVTI